MDCLSMNIISSSTAVDSDLKVCTAAGAGIELLPELRADDMSSLLVVKHTFLHVPIEHRADSEPCVRRRSSSFSEGCAADHVKYLNGPDISIPSDATSQPEEFPGSNQTVVLAPCMMQYWVWEPYCDYNFPQHFTSPVQGKAKGGRKSGKGKGKGNSERYYANHLETTASQLRAEAVECEAAAMQLQAQLLRMRAQALAKEHAKDSGSGSDRDSGLDAETCSTGSGSDHRMSFSSSGSEETPTIDKTESLALSAQEWPTLGGKAQGPKQRKQQTKWNR
jgi:hypothetical protein